jgi:integrase
MQALQREAGFAVNLAVRLLYGCGLRVSEPLNLRIKDIDLPAGQLVIRAAKGGKDRVVPIPCSVLTDLREQLESAQSLWQRDQHQRLPVALPHQLAMKFRDSRSSGIGHGFFPRRSRVWIRIPASRFAGGCTRPTCNGRFVKPVSKRVCSTGL